MKISANIKDVARIAGVSQACVSKYLNNKPYVSEKTCRKIKNAIEKISFTPSAIARSLVLQKTKNIGLIVLDITNPYQTEIIRGIEDYKSKQNLDYNVLLIDMLYSDHLGDKHINGLIENRVSGILTTSDRFSSGIIKYLGNIKLPIVFIGRYIGLSDVKSNYVIIDNLKGAYMMTEFLIGLGHRKIFYLTAQMDSASINDRLLGYKTAMEHYKIENLQETITYLEDFTFNAGYKAAKKIFSSKDLPTAIFCANDYSAFGVFEYCYKHKIKIPEDISVAGFDDIKFSSLDFINLTSIRIPTTRLGHIAAKIVFDQINNENEELIHVVLEPELIIRNSTRSIK